MLYCKRRWTSQVTEKIQESQPGAKLRATAEGMGSASKGSDRAAHIDVAQSDSDKAYTDGSQGRCVASQTPLSATGVTPGAVSPSPLPPATAAGIATGTARFRGLVTSVISDKLKGRHARSPPDNRGCDKGVTVAVGHAPNSTAKRTLRVDESGAESARSSPSAAPEKHAGTLAALGSLNDRGPSSRGLQGTTNIELLTQLKGVSDEWKVDLLAAITSDSCLTCEQLAQVLGSLEDGDSKVRAA